MITYITLICHHCYKEFKRSAQRFASNKCKNIKNFYCSKQCFNSSQVISILVNCKECNKEFLKLPSQILKTPNNFCSRSCAARYNNMHKTYGYRRSKLEIYLEEQIRLTYPNIELLCNNTEIIGAELDFYFPTLSLAIELNGIFHYEPIYGTNKLERTQCNDKKKIFLCNKNKINLAIVDSSSCKYLNQKAKDKYWRIFNEIILDSIKYS